MDLSNTTPILVFLMACASCVPGARLPIPDNLQVKILEEEVIVHWTKPVDAPSGVQYNVQFGRNAGEYTEVSKCTKITETFCILTGLIKDYEAIYKVRVQLEANNKHSDWTQKKKILLNSGELLPPSFTMWATSSTLTVHVHQKPILRTLFPFGLTYTIYLEEKGQNKTTIAYLKDDELNDQNEKSFRSLHWGKEYCVKVKVEVNTNVAWNLSGPQCLILPEQEWIIFGVASLTVAGFLIITAIIVTCILLYIQRPVKIPPALKSPVSKWRPFSLQDGPIEVVTDKGWFLFTDQTEVEHTSKNLPPSYATNQQSSEEGRRLRTDSGVSVKSSSSPARQEDSGCGSIGAQESINFPIQDEGSDTMNTVKTEDSGMGFSCHSDASSLNLEEADGKCLNKPGEYHKQKLLTTCVHDSDNDDMFQEKLPEPHFVSEVSGYRTNGSLCTCSGANLCLWCHNQSNYRGKYKGPLQNDNIMESYSSYSHNQMDNIDLTGTNLTLEQTFPMLTSLSSAPLLLEKGRDLNMNDVTISLNDVQLDSY